MKCNNCSTENKDDAKFCCNCGCKLATSIFPDFIERMASVPKFPIFSSGKLIITPTQLIFHPYSVNLGNTRDKIYEIKNIVGYEKGLLTYLYLYLSNGDKLTFTVYGRDEIISELEERRKYIMQNHNL